MKRYVLITLADSLFAVEAELVLEILELPWLSGWPGSPDSVLGLVDYRGVPTPVIDLSRRLGGHASRLHIHSQLLFFSSPSGTAALLVDSASDLVSLDADAHEPLEAQAHPGLLDRAAAYLRGLVTIGDQVALILELAPLVDFTLEVPGSHEPLAELLQCSPAERILLSERARSLARKIDESARRDTLNAVVVRLGDERFALDVSGVAELIRNSPVTPLPGGPTHLLGLIYHRGGLMRLVDIRPQLGLLAESLDLPEVVVLNGEGMLTGIGVEAIESVVSLDPDQFRPHSSGERDLPSLGSLPFQGAWLTLLDLDRLQVRAS